jgi:hypothetical protein
LACRFMLRESPLPAAESGCDRIQPRVLVSPQIRGRLNPRQDGWRRVHGFGVPARSGRSRSGAAIGRTTHRFYTIPESEGNNRFARQ